MTDADRQRRDTVNKYFGDALPDTTSDERDTGSAEAGDERERWLRDNVPPHHS